MKLYHYAWAVAAALLLLPGCSNDELVDSVPVPEYIPGDSEVEIRFSAHSDAVNTSVDKRATVDGDGDLDAMGVFCLARGKQEQNEGAPDIAWFSEDDHYASCLMTNVKAVKTGSNVAWADPNAHYFYPISQFYMYEFYGYYPYVEDGQITYESSADTGDGTPRHRATVHYTIDGSQDIIWGRATLADKHAYSARYFRYTDATLPVIQLQHLLTRLKFQVKPGVNPEQQDEAFADASKLHVKKIEVINTPVKLDLIVADQEGRDPAMGLKIEERLVVSPEDTGDGVVELKTADDQPLPEEGIAIGTDINTPVAVGGSLMLFPADKYLLRITLHKDGDGPEDPGRDFVTEETLTLGPPFGGESTYNAHISYTVTIVVNDVEEVNAQATLSSWTESSSKPTVEL